MQKRRKATKYQKLLFRYILVSLWPILWPCHTIPTNEYQRIYNVLMSKYVTKYRQISTKIQIMLY